MSYPRSLATFILVLSMAPCAWAAPERSSDVSRLSDAEVQTRLADAEQLLDSGETYADVWWYGWTSFYAIGVVYQSYQAYDSDNASKGREDHSNTSTGRRVEKIVGATKATIGVVGQFLRPLDAKEGADPIREMPSATPEDRLRQLAEAESRLQRVAKQSDERFSLIRHGMNVGINLAGGLIVAYGFDEETRGWRSAAVGIAVGEAMIWSMPWWGRSQLEDYQRRHNAGLPLEPRVSWSVVPTIGGAGLQMRF